MAHLPAGRPASAGGRKRCALPLTQPACKGAWIADQGHHSEGASTPPLGPNPRSVLPRAPVCHLVTRIV